LCRDAAHHLMREADQTARRGRLPRDLMREADQTARRGRLPRDLMREAHQRQRWVASTDSARRDRARMTAYDIGVEWTHATRELTRCEA
jgi:hypothetical protein